MTVPRLKIAVLAALVTLVLAGCGSAADVTTEHGSATEGSAVPALTDAGGIVVTARDLDPEGSYPPDPVAVAVYVEPLCPPCEAFSAEQGRLLDERLEEGAITLEYRVVSFLDGPTTDEASARSANAALCVATIAGPAAYASYVRAVMERRTPSDLSDDDLVDLADEQHADAAEGCIRDRDNADLVAQTTERALAVIPGTPTVVVDGRMLESIPTTAQLDALLGGRDR